MRKPVLLLLVLICGGVALSSCLESTSLEDYLQQKINAVDNIRLALDTKTIDDSLEHWGIRPDYLIEPNGVRYKIETPGVGQNPSLKSFIKLKWEGRLLSDSSVFDVSPNFQSYVYDLIVGLQTTLPLLREGTKATLLIPSGLGFGPVDLLDEAGDIKIPKNSNLIFKVELLEVQ